MKEKKKRLSKLLRLNTVYGMIFLAFTSLILRMAYIEIVRGQDLRGSAHNMQVSKIPVTPERGGIYDTNAQVMATNQPSQSIVLTRLASISDADYHHIANELGPVLGQTSAALYKLMTADQALLEVPLQRNATDKQVAFVSEHHSDFPNVSIQSDYKRTYPWGDLAGQVLGYVGPITAENQKKYITQDKYLNIQRVGESGIESQYEPDLQGKIGYQLVVMNPAGYALKKLGFLPDPTPGDNVQLTLDGHLQAESQMIMQNLIDKTPNNTLITTGAAVMLDVKTGGVLSMVSYPYLDPNWYENGTYSAHSKYLATSGAQANNAIQSTGYPGSTVKPANLMTGFLSGIVTPTTTIMDHVVTMIGGTPAKDDGDHGYVDPIRAIAVSCDTYFYELGLHLGKWFGSDSNNGGHWPQGESYTHYIQTDFIKGLNGLYQGEWNFGLGPKTGIDLPYETGGQFFNMNSKYQPVRYNLKASEASVQKTGKSQNEGTPAVLAYAGIGQEQQFTAMQLATYVMNIANNGVKLQPHLLQAVYNPEDRPGSGAKPIQVYTPKVTGKINANPQYWSTVHQGMYEVVNGGSDSTAAGVFDGQYYKAAGKTGTAQISIKGQATDNSVFICYAPFNNPQVAMAVMIPGGGYGASLAAVIARQMVDAYFAEHHEFLPKKQWTTGTIPQNWKTSPAYTIPEKSTS